MKDGRVFDFGVPNKLMSAGSELSVMLEDLAADGNNEAADNNDAEDEVEVVEKEEEESTVNYILQKHYIT